jgi:hypothetical protein
MVNKYYRAGQIMLINLSKVNIVVDFGFGFNNMNMIRDTIEDPPPSKRKQGDIESIKKMQMKKFFINGRVCK